MLQFERDALLEREEELEGRLQRLRLHLEAKDASERRLKNNLIELMATSDVHLPTQGKEVGICGDML